MFSLPLSSWLNPTPSASSGVTRPLTVTRPLLGGRMPEMVRNSVDLPAPLWPMTPYTDPDGTSKLTPRSASISRVPLARWPVRSRVLKSTDASTEVL